MPIYNIRDEVFDPRRALAVPSIETDLREEGTFLLVSQETIAVRGGPLARHLAEVVLGVAPPEEHDRLRFTVRVEKIRPGAYPINTPKSWHTDYAHGVENNQRLKVHNYVLITAAPLTIFLRESGFWLPDVREASFCGAIERAKPTPFQLEPWTFASFNATELHRAATWIGGESSHRLFFRATFDPLIS